MIGALAVAPVGEAASGSVATAAKRHKKHKTKKRICRSRHPKRHAKCIRVPRGVGTPRANQNSAAGPGFSGEAADGLGATNAGTQGAVDWAYRLLGSQAYDNWCGKFVAHAFNMPALGYNTAWQAAVAFGLHGGSPPPGTLVFFRRDGSNGYFGHVGIALPGNKMISAQSNGVRIADLGNSYWRALYAGWSPPPASWPGRPPTGSAPPLFPAQPAPQPTPAPQPNPAPQGNTPAPAVYPHHVVGTCSEGACGLKKRAGPGYTNYAQVGVVYDGQQIDIVCQTMGQAVQGLHATSAVWDKLSDGSYVSDYYTDTPNVGVFSPPIPQC
jgi:cell wall-associated NlpC family hydrolase